MNQSNPTLLSGLRSLPKPAWILFLGMFVNKFGAFVVPFLTIYLTKQGYSLADAGLAVGAYGAGNLGASILGGHLADRIGRRKTIVLSMFSGAAAMMLLSVARGLPAIMALTVLAGLTGEMYRPACTALLTDLVTPEQRVTSFSALRMAFNAGWAFGPATAGFLAERGFFWLFLGDATTSVIFGLVAFFALPRGVRSSAADGNWSDALRAIGQDRAFHRVLLAMLAIGLVFIQMATTFGLNMVRLGFSAKAYGMVLAVNGAMVVFCELPLTTITRRFPARRMMAMGYATGGIGFALNAFAHSILALVGCMVVFTFGEMMAMPVANAYVAGLAPTHLRGRYMGMCSLSWSLAMVVGPGLGVKLFAFGPSALWFTCGGLGLLAALVINGRGLRESPALVSANSRAGG